MLVLAKGSRSEAHVKLVGVRARKLLELDGRVVEVEGDVLESLKGFGGKVEVDQYSLSASDSPPMNRGLDVVWLSYKECPVSK